jgi:uncharacterized protein
MPDEPRAVAQLKCGLLPNATHFDAAPCGAGAQERTTDDGSRLVGRRPAVPQALLQATPTILVGVLVAGVFRRLLGHAGTRRLFGENTRRALLQAWLIGMLLPVCSLGVIPVVRELRRAGVSAGRSWPSRLTAPLFNPISVLYGLTLSEPVVIVTFCFCSLVIVTVVGLAWDRLFPGHGGPEDPNRPRSAYGIKRMLAVAVTAAEELVGPAAAVHRGRAGGRLAVEHRCCRGYLQQAAEHDDPWAPLFMATIAIPAYATPMTAMVQLASMFQHGNSVGAAFALLALGAGANLGLDRLDDARLRSAADPVWFGILVAVVVGLAYGVDKPLYPHGVDPAGHTHAFDGYCCSVSCGRRPRACGRRGNCWPRRRRRTSASVDPGRVAGGGRTGPEAVRPREQLETWLQRQPAAAAALRHRPACAGAGRGRVG